MNTAPATPELELERTPEELVTKSDEDELDRPSEELVSAPEEAELARLAEELVRAPEEAELERRAEELVVVPEEAELERSAEEDCLPLDDVPREEEEELEGGPLSSSSVWGVQPWTGNSRVTQGSRTTGIAWKRNMEGAPGIEPACQNAWRAPKGSSPCSSFIGLTRWDDLVGDGAGQFGAVYRDKAPPCSGPIGFLYRIILARRGPIRSPR